MSTRRPSAQLHFSVLLLLKGVIDPPARANRSAAALSTTFARRFGSIPAPSLATSANAGHNSRMTSTSTPAELPSLTSLEADAAIAVAWAAPGATMLQVAARLKLAPSELTEILERPHVAAFAHAAREIELMHADAVARHNRAAAIADLAAVAKDEDATLEMRFHASIAILKALQGAPTTPAAPRPRQLQCARPTSAPRLSLPAPAKPPPPPAVPASASGTPTDPGGPRPDLHKINQTTPAPRRNAPPGLPAPSASPVTLRCAAGALTARRTDVTSAHSAPRAAPSPTPDRPP